MKTYKVIIGDEQFEVNANTLKEAKCYANANKRRGKIKGTTRVCIKREWFAAENELKK